MRLSKKENVDMVQQIEVSLLGIGKECASLLEKTNKYLHHLPELIDNPFAYDSHQFRTEHEVIEDELTQFVKDFRKNRNEIFKTNEEKKMDL